MNKDEIIGSADGDDMTLAYVCGRCEKGYVVMKRNDIGGVYIGCTECDYRKGIYKKVDPIPSWNEHR